MRIDPFVISVFFRLINFFVLIAVVIYLYKKYASPFLGEQIQEKKDALQSLKNQKSSFEGRQQEISSNTVEQEKLGRSLATKIDLWRQDFDKESERIEEKRVEIASVLEQRMQTRNYYITLLCVQRVVIRQAIDETEDILYQKFADNEVGQQFIQSIVNEMEHG